LFKNIYTTFASNFISALLNLLIAVVISQTLGAHVKGEQSIILTNIVIILLFNNIIGGATLVYIVPRFDNRKVLQYSYLWAFMVCSGAFFITRFIPGINHELLLHTFILTFISALASANTMILLGKEKIPAKNAIQVLQISGVAIFLVFAIFVLKIENIHAYIYALYFGYGSSLLLSIILLAKHWKAGGQIADAKQPLIPSMFRFGFFNQLSHITQMLSLRLSYYLLLLFYSNESVGIYSVAVAITESVWLISKSIATVQYARITNSIDESYNRQLTVKLLRSSLLFSVLMIFGLSILPVSFFRFMFGEEFGPVKKIILLLIPGIFFYNLYLIPGHYFSGKGKYHINTVASAIGLLVTLALGLILIPLYDFYGAAMTGTASFIATSAYAFIVFRKISGFPLREFFPGKGDIEEYIRFFKKTPERDAEN
jgi:O-antigen/teichoic acid export membrane protein